MPRLIPVSTLARYAAERDAPGTVRGLDARAVQHGIRWHENLAATGRRPFGPRRTWAAIIALAIAGVVLLIG